MSTVEGCCEGPNDELDTFPTEQLDAADTFVFGRVTAELMDVTQDRSTVSMSRRTHTEQGAPR